MISPNPTTYAADRVFRLQVKDGATALKGTGILDPNLFKEGESRNRLHALMDGETCLWYFKYEKGGLPPALKDQTFTSFNKAYKFAEEYFSRRNVDIIGVDKESE